MADTHEGGSGGGGDPAELDQTEGNVSSEQSALQLTESGSDELWTVDEMEHAEPCDIIEIDEADDVAEGAFSVEDEEGGSAVAGGEPDEDEQTGDAETLATTGGYNYPPPYTSFPVFAPYTLYPYRCVGKLFFKRGGKSYVCSASSIGNNAIWTAGHCLHSGNNSSSGWATNVVFVPAYKNGAAPYGQWQAKQLFVRTAWYRDGNPKGLCQDMGAAVLHKRGGKKISQTVGWLGFAWNWSKYQHWTQLGYPAGTPYNGMKLIVNASSYAYDGNPGCSPRTVGVGSDLTGGSSGGPWVLKFGTKNYVNGNNSYRRRGMKHEMYSPRFDNNAKSLFELIRKKE